MHAYRTRIAGDILCEFLPPKKPSNDVIIIAPGMPSMPNAGRLLRFLHKKNYWGFFVRYRGTWESAGQFLTQEPTQDILDIVEALQHPFHDIWNKQPFHIQTPRINVIGISFGGPAALLSSSDPRIHKGIAIAGVSDWRIQSDDEPLPLLKTLTQEAFGQGYRFDDRDWAKLGQDDFYNPATNKQRIDPKKIYCIHSTDDTIVPIEGTRQFLQKTQAASYILNKGGHLSKRAIMRWRIWRNIHRFIQRG